MRPKINIDPAQLTELRKTYNMKELAAIFGCSKKTISRRLESSPKEEPKKRFTPKAREMLFESYLDFMR
jgi:transcriptional antiterminator